MRAALLCTLMLAAGPKKPDVAASKFFEPLGRPSPGEWLALHAEAGETFAEYKAAEPMRPTSSRTRIYLKPWLTRPARDPEVLDRIAKALAAWFQRTVFTLAAEPLPLHAYDAKKRQYQVAGVAKVLVKELPADALLVLAVTDRDLRLPGFASALGWGSLKHRVAVMSTHRLGRGESALRRTIGLALHEATHGLSLRHCTFYKCLMNGAASAAEADRRPLLMCPVCRSKLCWNLELDPMDRYQKLAQAFAVVGLLDDARAARKAAEAERSTAR
ncbi:MAG: archaemetzincin [Planctomycetota bacterium]